MPSKKLTLLSPSNARMLVGMRETDVQRMVRR